MTVILIGLLFVVLCTLGYLALRNAQDFSDANEIIPGVATRAPKEWAGAHTPEARLHRRIRDAMTSLRSNVSLDAPELTSAREGLEAEALAIDERLISVATLPGKSSADLVGQVTTAVEALEAAVTEVVLLRGPTAETSTAAIDAVRQRLAFVEQARAELSGIGATPDLDALRRRMDDVEEPTTPTSPEQAAGDGGADPSADPGVDPGTG